MSRTFILSGKQSIGAILQDAARSSAAAPRKRSHLLLNSKMQFLRRWISHLQKLIPKIHIWFFVMVSMPISRS